MIPVVKNPLQSLLEFTPRAHQEMWLVYGGLRTSLGSVYPVNSSKHIFEVNECNSKALCEVLKSD